MSYEKILFFESGRSVKLLIPHSISMDPPSIIEIEVLVKEPRDTDFHPPIGVCHPKYWKLKTMDAQQARRLQVRYSGLTKRQINQVLREFRKSLVAVSN